VEVYNDPTRDHEGTCSKNKEGPILKPPVPGKTIKLDDE